MRKTLAIAFIYGSIAAAIYAAFGEKDPGLFLLAIIALAASIRVFPKKK
ncbi:MAG: hypothetical protein LiPW15_85 [Parcubacteria group bacterium LiPW_15]|nr:MAG: hypothetical protein LiPW15_85 [Parcubacteria group bacterium LiPW_15]